MSALIPILQAVLPPLLKMIADAIEKREQTHAEVAASLQAALTDAASRVSQLAARFAASDADFESKLRGGQ